MAQVIFGARLDRELLLRLALLGLRCTCSSDRGFALGCGVRLLLDFLSDLGNFLGSFSLLLLNCFNSFHFRAIGAVLATDSLALLKDEEAELVPHAR